MDRRTKYVHPALWLGWLCVFAVCRGSPIDIESLPADTAIDSSATRDTSTGDTTSTKDSSKTDDSTNTKDSVITGGRDWRANEPEGYAAIVGRSFNSKASDDGGRGTGGFPYKSEGSPANVAQLQYPEGFNGGRAAVLQGPNAILGNSIAILLPTDAFPQTGGHEP